MNLSAIGLQGLQQAQAKFDQAATRLASSDAPPAGTPADSINLSEAAVSLLSARNQFDANLKTLQTADRMAQRAIDLLA